MTTSASCTVPNTICGILEKLVGEKVIIILESGDKELVKVAAVIDGNILVASIDKKIKFVDCGCICAVIADCLDVISDRLNCNVVDS